MALRLVSVLLIVFSLSACVSSNRSTHVRSTDPVVHEELVGLDVPDAFHGLQRLRPGWLRSRGAVSLQRSDAGFPVVYVDALRHGGLESLHQIPVSSVHRIEFIGSAEAGARFGTGHPGGVILVSTRPK